MKDCKLCHVDILQKHKILAFNHEKYNMDYITRSKLGICTRCSGPVGMHRYHICKACWKTKADFIHYTHII